MPILVIAASFAAALPGHAEAEARPGAAREAGEARRIGPGDVLEVRVWREPDLSGRHRVGVDGDVQHVLAGAVRAAGKSPDELAQVLRARLERDSLREARVAVTLVESHRRRASALGAVESPGAYAVTEEARVLDLLAAAGGPALDSSGTATLLRFGGALPAGQTPSEEDALERIEIDLSQLLAGKDLTGNHPVREGDVLVLAGRGVSSAPSGGVARIRVIGEVGNPGGFELAAAPTLLDAVLAAGGLGEYAAANKARLVRVRDGEREELRVRLGELMEGGEGQPNVALQDGDLIVVPESFF